MPEQGVEVVNDEASMPVELPSPPVVLEPPPTPGAEVESPDSQPVTEIQALTPGAEVTTDAPAPTPTASSTRSILRKKSESVALLLSRSAR